MHLIGNPELPWILDTGATVHATGFLGCLFDQFDGVNCPITLPNGSVINSIRRGKVKLSTSLILKNVFFVPSLNCNLISISQLLDEQRCDILFTRNSCFLQDRISRMVIGAGERRGGLYYFSELPKVSQSSLLAIRGSDLELWHSRLGHPSEAILRSLPFISSSTSVKNNSCETCYHAKHTRDVFFDNFNKAIRCFELIHCDLWGLYRVPSSCGARYFLTIVDDFSRALWVILLVDKTEVYSVFLKFFAMVKRQFNLDVRRVRSDNGTEFNCLKSYFSAHGIIFQTSCVGTPQQNGRVERKHRHILNVARALRFQGSLPIDFWGECVLGACYLINRTPSRILNFKSPYEILYGVAPML